MTPKCSMTGPPDPLWWESRTGKFTSNIWQCYLGQDSSVVVRTESLAAKAMSCGWKCEVDWHDWHGVLPWAVVIILTSVEFYDLITKVLYRKNWVKPLQCLSVDTLSVSLTCAKCGSRLNLLNSDLSLVAWKRSRSYIDWIQMKVFVQPWRHEVLFEWNSKGFEDMVELALKGKLVYPYGLQERR